MRLERKVKCKLCGKKDARDWVYKFWHFVVCYEYVKHLDITWVKTWWLCTSCAPEASTWRGRFHDIDGFTYEFSPKPPFFRRS